MSSPDPTVFIVDDDEAVRDSVAILLECAGFRVESYDSPLAFLQSDAPSRRGCLLVDVRMPQMSGLDLQERLVQEGRALPVIVMTGHADVPLAVRAMKAGAIDFVEKPFEEQALVDSVRSALARAGNGAADPPAAPAATTPPPPEPAVSPEIQARLDSLTPRERDVLQWLVEGKSNKVIAFELSISPRTVEIHRARVMEKMRADSLPSLVRMALSAGVGPRSAE
ncbi:response regulator FixJ [Azospirillum rugosum]|uniref:Two-component system response regulator FixJ n=1 Tax=Azospirillum rugosum TaxID=416170 RepID=A0ABS4SUH0_9PROT|nr:response regulator FixJ [Azospirillum rugosum]MBP2296199.1 two-component system response regulator FixJ [Azospirillum rugosum]MDQ0527116.1 two-component system response regulator FixJ [Azospirillum rugosum]